MKKILWTISMAAFLAACGGNSGSSGGDKKDDGTAETPSRNPEAKKGLDLIAKSDCLTCHKVDETVTGPSYRDVANKYATYPDTIVAHLAHKVREGGTGVWGSVFMTPHPGVTQEDAETMVKYVLSLKKN